MSLGVTIRIRVRHYAHSTPSGVKDRFTNSFSIDEGVTPGGYPPTTTTTKIVNVVTDRSHLNTGREWGQDYLEEESKTENVDWDFKVS